jgi:hypothetical protein
MSQRLYPIAIVAFWLLSMAWLISTKVLPAFQQGSPPDFRDEFAKKAEAAPPPVAWDLLWNEKSIGTAVSQAYSDDGEPAEFRSLVEFHDLAVRDVMHELLGGLSFLADSLLGGGQSRVDLTIATRLRLDWEGELGGFESAVTSGDGQDLLFLRGTRTEEDRLKLTLRANDTAFDVPQEFNLPPKARYAEAFSPRTRMQGLVVGQRWTTPVVDPLASSSSVRLVESLVESRETITWQNQPIETFLVIYRYDSGSGAAARDPVGKVWIRCDDGLVIRQELPIGSARVRFERTSDQQASELGVELERQAFDQHLHRPPK